MMKKILGLLGLFGLLVFAGSAWSLTMTDVGSVDQFIAAADLGNSSDQGEVDWVNSVLGTSFTTVDLTKTDTPSGGGWVAVSGVSNIYAFDFNTTGGVPYPEYFFIKTGNLQVIPNEHFLYGNLNEFRYGVINLTGAGFTIQNIGKLSHIGELGTTQVPEPGTLLLMGSGLAGLALFGRRRFKA